MSIKELKKLYDDSVLISTYQQVKNNSEASRKIIEDLMIPKVTDVKITILGYTFDPSETIFQDATAEETIEAWNYTNGQISLREFLKIYLIIQTSTFGKKELEVKVDDSTYISNTTEPIVIDLVRFCYWVYINSKINNNDAFHTKLKDIDKSTKIDTKQLDSILNIIRIVIQDILIKKDVKNDIVLCISKTVHKMISKFSDFNSEMMLSAIIKMSNHEVEFIIEREGEQTSDLILDKSIKAEIKTIHDDPCKSLNIESQLETEIKETIKRIKIRKIIKNAIDQYAEIIILELTRSSVGIKFLDQVYKSGNKDDFTFSKAINSAIEITKDSLNNNIEHIPIIIFSTGIKENGNFSHHIYANTLEATLSNENGKRVIDTDNLTVHL